MIIEPNGGWLERNGKREPMPELMLRQERQQFAIYGQMQLALAQGVIWRVNNRWVTIKGDGIQSVDTEFLFDVHGRLVEARNAVADAEKPGITVSQLFKFSGEIRSDGLSWPRHMEMYHGEAPYFVLDIQSFKAT